MKAERKDFELWGKAVKLRVREMTIGLRHPFNLRAEVRESLEVEIKWLKLLDEVNQEIINSSLRRKNHQDKMMINH